MESIPNESIEPISQRESKTILSDRRKAFVISLLIIETNSKGRASQEVDQVGLHINEYISLLLRNATNINSLTIPGQTGASGRITVDAPSAENAKVISSTI